MRWFILLLSFFLCACSSHVPFNRVDKTLLVASTLSLAVDWRQTVSIDTNPKTEVISDTGQAKTLRITPGHTEKNPILGNQPSDEAVASYFIGCALINAGVAYVLPPYYRTIWLSSILVFELAVIRDNHLSGNVGIKTIW